MRENEERRDVKQYIMEEIHDFFSIFFINRKYNLNL